MKAELEKLRVKFDVPENQPQDISNPDTRYHSSTMHEKAMEQDKMRAAKGKVQ